MPRVHKVEKARKDYPDFGIQRGDSYYHWAMKTRYGSVKRKSKTYPKRSQLTLSDFLGQAYDLSDNVSEAKDADTLRDLANDVEALRDEQQEKLDNMPEQLQSAPSGETIQERIQECDDWMQALNEAADEIDEIENNEELDEEEKNEQIADVISGIDQPY